MHRLDAERMAAGGQPDSDTSGKPISIAPVSARDGRSDRGRDAHPTGAGAELRSRAHRGLARFTDSTTNRRGLEGYP